MPIVFLFSSWQQLQCPALSFVAGEFGTICQGHLIVTSRPWTPVTIETLSETATEADHLDFVMTAKMMRKLDDVNVVYLHGVVMGNSRSSPHLIVMEHMRHGSLLQLIHVRI